MTEVYADAFYWLATLNPDDVHYPRVSQHPVKGRLVSTTAVCLEVMDALCHRRLRPLAVRFWGDLQNNRLLVVVPIDDSLLTRAGDLFSNRMDKDWSLTDCISFVVMTERGIRTALTGDHHFEQAGFEIAFKS
jgi:predicted nucleic acid-binding protein